MPPLAAGMDTREASSQAGWALVMEAIADARVGVHRLRHLCDRATRLVEDSDHKEHLYEVAGDIITGVPGRVDRLESSLDKASYAMTRLGEDYLRDRLPISDRSEVDDAVEGASPFPGGRKKSRVQQVAAAYLRAVVQRQRG